MNLSFALALSFLSAAHSKNVNNRDEAVYRPQRFSMKSLKDKDSFVESGVDASFIDALSNVGILSVTDIPAYASYKEEALSWVHACSLESAASQDHTYPDGTVRRTMATHTVPGRGGVQKIAHKTESPACAAFEKASDQLREVVAEVTQIFSARLSSVLDTSSPLMTTEDGDYQFNTMEDVVESGEHLEHFHSYQRTEENGNDEPKTIDVHTDQGLFIAFTPGLMVVNSATGADTSSLSSGFYIELQDGTRALAEFKDDELVFMLGDGVNQYINTKVQNRVLLRATPHALSMPYHAEDEARVWYGRMILPPSSAFNKEHGHTYGHMRKLMIDASLNNKDEPGVLGLGCSSSSVARQLEEVTCEEGTTYCWHRCMENNEYHNVSHAICASRDLELKCVNPRGQLYVDGHGDFFPDCTDSNVTVTPFTTLPGYPRDEGKCEIGAWDAFKSAEGFDSSYDLGQKNKNADTNKARFMWNIVDGKVHGKLAFNGLHGYMDIGYYTGGKYMYGAEIIMSLPGGNYSPVTGLDLNVEANVKEYIISNDYSRFRHWSQPVGTVGDYNVTETDCFTSLEFTTDSINGKKFNLTGSNEMLWAAQGSNSFIEFHGRDQRDYFTVDWANGKAWEGEHDHGHDSTDEEDHDYSAESTKSVAFVSMSSLAVLLLSLGAAISLIM